MGTSEPDLGVLRKQAEALASRRHETPGGVHLLAAIAATPSAASDLLVERGATARQLLNALDALGERGPEESVVALLGRARELAQRMGPSTRATPAHLLVALLNDTRGTARRCLEAVGVDPSRLRTAALNLGQGILGRRRVLLPAEREGELSPAPPKGVAVPLVPVAQRPPPAEAARLPGQAVPVVPQVGPAPLARLRLVAEAASAQGASFGSGAAPTSAPETTADAVSPVPPASVAAKGRPVRGAAPASDAPVEDDATSRFGLDPRRFPVLAQLGKNLCLAAARGELDPVIGRESEIEQALDVLAKRQGNNPCLVGVAGVGKTSVARGLAQRIAAGEEVTSLDDRVIVEIPVAELFAGTGIRGALAGRLAALKKEVRLSEGRVVLFFDEIHQLFANEAAEEIAGDLKLALACGELPCIGATTPDEYRRYIEADAALARRFSPVEVDQPSREDAYLILDSLARKLEAHHRVSYEPEALALSVAWSMRYLPGRALPDKAVSIVDLAGARVRRRGGTSVSPEAVAEVVASLAGMPTERLLESDGDRMLRLEEILGERVIGHDDHMSRIARILRRNAAGLSSRRPIGTFLLLGPTGVGKTETAKAIAEVLFHTESAMTRIDMSELSEAHAVAKLVGAPPGYVGHDAGGQLTEAVRRRPYQVVLLDEIEKAHPEVLTAFLAVFDEGRMTDGRGRTVDFTNTVIVLTSNLGAGEISGPSRRRVGFSTNESGADALSDKVVTAARQALPPELYNRIDEVLVFAPLSRDDVRRITRKMLANVARALEEQRGVRLDVEEAALDHLLDAGGYDPELGARPMRRTLARLVEAPLAEKILRGELRSGSVVLLSIEEGELVFDTFDAGGSEAGCSAAQ
jgi:ATP-dependent Clp protease ATP-binding subunit ClpC